MFVEVKGQLHMSILRVHSNFCLRMELSLACSFARLDGSWAHRAPSLSAFHLTLTGISGCITVSIFHMGSRDLNSGPLAWKATTLWSEPSLQTRNIISNTETYLLTLGTIMTLSTMYHQRWPYYACHRNGATETETCLVNKKEGHKAYLNL